MCKAKIEVLVDCLQDHLGEERNLDEWKNIINDVLSRQRRLTPREVAFAFKVIKYKKLLSVEKEFTSYCFLSSEVPAASIAHIQ